VAFSKDNIRAKNNLGQYIKSFARFEEVGIFITLIILCIILSICNDRFLTFANVVNVLRRISQTAIMAVGMAYVIITGGIDLSIGSTTALGGVLAAIFARIGVNPLLAILIALGAGMLTGALNGLMIVKININPFITTLAMMNVIKGITYLITGGMPTPFNTSLNFLGGGSIANIPVPIFIMGIILIIGHIILRKTVFGRSIYAVGGNERYAELSGINTKTIKIVVYSILGTLSALVGVIIASNLKIADTAAGNGSEMDVIAAVVIGGASMSGGTGSILGVLIGTAIMGVIRNGFVLLRLSSYLQMLSIGLVIILAVTLDQIKKRGRM
jgi:ribose transport system permease protein